jgi:hypothetical protein
MRKKKKLIIYYLSNIQFYFKEKINYFCDWDIGIDDWDLFDVSDIVEAASLCRDEPGLEAALFFFFFW